MVKRNFRSEIIAENEQEPNVLDKKNNLHTLLKTVGLILIFAVAYGTSLLLNGFKETNEKLFVLLICAVCGFVAFFLIYYLLYFISVIKLNKKRKKQSENIIRCDDEVAEFFDNNDYKFYYQRKLTVKENLFNALGLGKNIVSAIANEYSKGGKYDFLNYTVYDALDIFGNAIDEIFGKADKVFSFIGMQDKPLGFVENYLAKILIEEQQSEEEIAVTEIKQPSGMRRFFGGIKDKVINAGKTVGIMLFSGKIESVVNEIMVFVAGESFRVYGKNGKKKDKRDSKSGKNE